MKYLNLFVPFLLACLLVACNETDRATSSSSASETFDSLSRAASSKITHEDGWAIVSKMEDSDRVYWFFAPDIDNVSPAMFKKTVFGKDNNKQGFEVVSKCDAPKQVCDELMRKFETLSEQYR